jgi:hypothetical protein
MTDKPTPCTCGPTPALCPPEAEPDCPAHGDPDVLAQLTTPATPGSPDA